MSRWQFWEKATPLARMRGRQGAMPARGMSARRTRFPRPALPGRGEPPPYCAGVTRRMRRCGSWSADAGLVCFDHICFDTRNWVCPCPYKGHHRQRLNARRRWLRDGCAPACNRRNACNLTSTSNRQVLSTGRYAPTAAGRCGLRVSCPIWRTAISAALSAQSASTIKPWLCSSDNRRKKT